MRFAISFLLLVCCGCSQGDGRIPVLRLAVTTSTRDSGLLDQLLPAFETQQNVRVDVIGVGTGAALKLGETGDVDVLWVHSRADEDEFMAAGHGVRREDVMTNSFLILGPKHDPAGIAGLPPSEAIQRIVVSGECLVSRGDNSGTAKREISIWAKSPRIPPWPKHVETGQGMGATLTVANQMNGYVLTDSGTYLRFKDRIQIVPLVTDSPLLENPYGIIAVNPEKNSLVRGDLANAFIDFLISPESQEKIGLYQVHGEPLFRPLQPTRRPLTVEN